LNAPTIEANGMKTDAQMNRAKKCLPHLTYSAFCLAARHRNRGIWRLTAAAKNANSFCPVKHKRALLESNPPRDNWIERRRNKNVSAFGEAKTSPNAKRETFISEPEHALKNSFPTVQSFHDGQFNQKPLRKNYLNRHPFFRSKRIVTSLHRYIGGGSET
jgi:hypothetical protein